MSDPILGYVIPAANENRWSDLLATLIATDPLPIAAFVGGEPDQVKREAVVPGLTRKSDRLDLLLLRGGQQLAAIEVKLLSDLGPRQLERYAAAFPDANSHHVLHLAGLPVNVRSAPGWQSLTWEAVLMAYSQSQHPWVATTATAWLKQLDALVPQVDAGTVWNDLPDDASGFELALRARVAWLAMRMDSWCHLDHDLLISSGGGAWVVAMRADTTLPDHQVFAELQEGLPAREWRFDPSRRYRDRLKGPVILVGLCQRNVTTSADFDWPMLHRLFDEPALAERTWVKTSANPRDPIDRANWTSMVAAGAPKWLGKGYGMATAKTHQVCAFGANLQLAPTLTLGEIDTYLHGLQCLVVRVGSPKRVLD